MIRNICRLGITLLAVLPAPVFAGVRINEVAWMGTTDNANAEWIELLNTQSTPMSLTNWTLISSSGTPNITLTGTIDGNGFYLLTRTSVNNVSGVTGDQAYTGALANTGVTLTLKEATGTEVDSVVGGSNWEAIGGDNVTKKTPQRGESGWVTATPTPRAPNAEILGDDTTDDGGVLEDDTATTTPIVTINGFATNTTPVFTVPKLYIFPGPSRTVSLYADTPFRAYVYDEKGKPRRSEEVSWSFGDGARESGKEVHHTFETEGTYLVVVRAQNDNASSIATLTVEVLPASVSVGTVSDAGISLNNTTNRMVDISGWQLKSGAKKFVMPEGTALLPHASVTFPTSITKLNPYSGTVTLSYPGGRLASEYRNATVEVLSEKTVTP